MGESYTHVQFEQVEVFSAVLPAHAPFSVAAP
jgi:hypothetical protein